jgi:hypothetical protein
MKRFLLQAMHLMHDRFQARTSSSAFDLAAALVFLQDKYTITWQACINISIGQAHHWRRDNECRVHVRNSLHVRKDSL